MRPIGYYVHHHGDGHRQRSLALAAEAQGRITLLGTGLAGRCGDVPVVDLPDDRRADGRFDGDDGVLRPLALHYAPVDHDGVRRRVAAISAWIAEARPALMVIDVSVEIAMLARLASVPTVYVRLSGRRDDAAHLEAFRGASALLAPFAEGLDDPDTPEAIRRLTIYAPGLGIRRDVATVDETVVLVVVGRGGDRADGETWAAAAHAVPACHWRVIGPCSAPSVLPGNLEILGWVEDAASRIAGAGVVVGAAGDGLVGSVIASRRPFICVPEARPHDEQTSKAARLFALRAAILPSRRPEPEDWPDLIARARTLDLGVLTALDAEDGARRAARRLLELADALTPAKLETA